MPLSMVTVSPGEGWLRGTVDALHSHAKVSTDNAETMAVMVMLAEETSRRHMSSFTAWSDDVFFRQGAGWIHGAVDALRSHVQGVDSQR